MTMQTSLDAYDKVKPRAPNMRAQVLAAIREAGSTGLTDHELAQQFGKGRSYSGIPSRRGELHKMGLVEPTEVRRKTGFDNDAVVWVLSSLAHSLVGDREITNADVVLPERFKPCPLDGDDAEPILKALLDEGFENARLVPRTTKLVVEFEFTEPVAQRIRAILGG